MNPEEQIHLNNLREELKRAFELQIREHEHDGNQASQVKTFDLFDQGKNVNAIRYLHIQVFAPTTSVTTGDGKYYFHIPAEWERFYLVEAHAEHITAGATSGNTTVQIANVTDAVDMLSTLLTIDTAETGSDESGTAYVINLSNDQISENDLIRIDVDSIQSPAPSGLIVTLGFREFRK